jgi:hypothetical protein
MFCNPAVLDTLGFLNPDWSSSMSVVFLLAELLLWLDSYNRQPLAKLKKDSSTKIRPLIFFPLKNRLGSLTDAKMLSTLWAKAGMETAVLLLRFKKDGYLRF